MEILNNIWVAISTPNEVLINIIAIPALIIESLLVILLPISILNIQTIKSQNIKYVILITISGLISMYIISAPYNTFFNFFMIIILAHFIYKITILKSAVSIVASAISFNLINFFILNPYITFFHITSNELATIPIYRFLYILIVYTFISLLIIFIRSKKFKLIFTDTVDKKSKMIIFTNLTLGIITIIIHSIILFYYVDNLPILITFLSFVSFLAYFTISIYSLTRVFKLVSTTRKLENAEAYNHTLHILHDNVRGFKHDFDNIVTTIGGYIRTEDMEGLKKYYMQLEDDCQRVNNLYILNPDVVNNNGIYNLLTKKYHEADSKDIKVNISFLLDLNTLHMKIYEFARILGILLDNAIEASSECEEKIINIVFRNDVKNSRQLVIVENTYKNKDIDTEKIFEKGVSGKENHTGLGLWEVRKLIKKNNNINLYTSKTEKLFIQQLEIYY